MFGGHGIYLDDLMFALTYGERLWLKVDGHNRDRFIDAGGAAFTYRREPGKVITMSFVSVPNGVWTNPDQLIAWASDALAAARRNQAFKQARKRKTNMR